jgi:2'-5' RNA ligase superfamily
VPGADGQFESVVTLVLADQAPELAAAHDELYPERVPEGIPLTITLLYPFIPAPSLREADLAALRSFFASRRPFSFEIARVAQWERSRAVYGVPEPDDELRALMRALWARYPQYPPYGEPGGDPPPHASLTLDGGDDPDTLRARVEQRLAPLLPARFTIREATLQEEYEPDRLRVRETFRLGA